MAFCKIVLTNSLQTFSDQPLNELSYAIPEEIKDKLAIGKLVLVPFRQQKENGLVIDIYQDLSEAEQNFKIREIEDLLSDEIIYDRDLIDLIRFTAKHYACSYSEVLSATLTPTLVKKPQKTIKLLSNLSTNTSPIIQALEKARKQQLSWARLKSLTRIEEQELKKQIRKLKEAGLIEIEYKAPSKKTLKKTNHLRHYQDLDAQTIPDLKPEQAHIVEQISNHFDQSYKALIHGITGSGKTEVYLRLIQKSLEQSKSTIVLVPEIALAPQLIERVVNRFGEDTVLVWHSALSKSEREHTLNEIIHNKSPKIIIGARSAIFAPVKNLGLIIIDEEHENSYKQDSPSPRYHARLIAEKRSELSQCPLVMGSATPNIETYYKALSPEHPDYHLFKLSKRVFDNPLPKVVISDMRTEFNNANKSIFSRFLRSKITEALEKQEQIILFLNKRGAASHVFCRNCGYVYHCSNCDAKTVYHSDRKIMLCHHCGFSEAHPQECPECNSSAIKFFGLGTQKLEQETIRAFPNARIARLDSDVSKIQNNYLNTWRNFKNHEIDILIGTQMIAKGLDNPNLTVVGVISADANFSQLDYQADERGFQLLTQVAGRAGRAEKPGIVVFQTYQPERSALLDAQTHNYEDFYLKEIALREEFHYPPFGQIVRLLCSTEKELDAIETCNKIHKELFEIEGLSIMGPSPAMIGRLNNKFRYHIIVKLPNQIQNQAEKLDQIKKIFFKINKDTKAILTLDIDNISLY